MTPSEYIAPFRCPVCAMPLLPGDSVAWCSQRDCPHTVQRAPTEQQIRRYALHDVGTANVLPRRGRG